MPTILPVQKSDLPDAANLLHTSKLALPINRLLYKNWPADAAQAEQCLNAVTGVFHNPTMESFKVVDPETKEMVAYLVLAREKGKAVKWGDEVKTAKENTNERFDERILEWVEKSSLSLREDFAERDHFRIIYTCVEVSHRLHGIGSALVKLCIERAEAEGIPLLVTSEPEPLGFFNKLGFKEAKHCDIDLSVYAPVNSGFGVFRLTGLSWGIEV